MQIFPCFPYFIIIILLLGYKSGQQLFTVIPNARESGIGQLLVQAYFQLLLDSQLIFKLLLAIIYLQMQSATKSTYGLCSQCINTHGLNMLQSKKSAHCTTCQKQPDILFNQEPYCASCYILTIASPTKSQRSSQRGHRKNKSFFTPIDKQQVKIMKKSFLGSSGKLIKKISKAFQQYPNQAQLISFLNKKGTSFGNIEWQKFVPKVNKSSNIVYIFIGKSIIIGAFHSQSVNIDGQASVWDSQAGIFKTQISKFEPQFGRVKSDSVVYSSKSKIIKFGSPSSFEICLDKTLKVSSQLAQDFEWVHCFIYRP